MDVLHGPTAIYTSANQSSSSGWVEVQTVNRSPLSSHYATPHELCPPRLTVTRATSGFSGEVTSEQGQGDYSVGFYPMNARLRSSTVQTYLYSELSTNHQVGLTCLFHLNHTSVEGGLIESASFASLTSFAVSLRYLRS